MKEGGNPLSFTFSEVNESTEQDSGTQYISTVTPGCTVVSALLLEGFVESLGKQIAVLRGFFVGCAGCSRDKLEQ